jgi:hypothetical protein
VAISMPDTMANVTFYTDLLHATIPLAMSALVLAGAVVSRLVPASWATLTWVLTAALIIPPISPYLGLTQVKGLVFCLGVLWLLPRVAGVNGIGQPWAWRWGGSCAQPDPSPTPGPCNSVVVGRVVPTGVPFACHIRRTSLISNG